MSNHLEKITSIKCFDLIEHCINTHNTINVSNTYGLFISAEELNIPRIGKVIIKTVTDTMRSHGFNNISYDSELRQFYGEVNSISAITTKHNTKLIRHDKPTFAMNGILCHTKDNL